MRRNMLRYSIALNEALSNALDENFCLLEDASVNDI